jgi:tetratricopeptide (TPR) repeat protein
MIRSGRLIALKAFQLSLLLLGAKADCAPVDRAERPDSNGDVQEKKTSQMLKIEGDQSQYDVLKDTSHIIGHVVVTVAGQNSKFSADEIYFNYRLKQISANGNVHLLRFGKDVNDTTSKVFNIDDNDFLLTEPNTTVNTGAYQLRAVEHYNKGVEFHQQGWLSKALVEYRAALDADPRMEEALSNMGGIFLAQNQKDKAVDCFVKALSMAHQNSIAIPTVCNLANLYDDQGESVKAEDLYRKLLSLPSPAKDEVDRQMYRRSLVRYAQLLGRAGRRVEAKIVNARVAEIRD